MLFFSMYNICIYISWEHNYIRCQITRLVRKVVSGFLPDTVRIDDLLYTVWYRSYTEELVVVSGTSAQVLLVEI